MKRRTLLLALAALPFTAAGESPVVTAEGSGGRTLRPFTVADQWELQWNARGGMFQAYLFDDANGEMVGIIANQLKDGPGASYQRKGGRYYLQINALGDWTVTVVQLQKPTK